MNLNGPFANPDLPNELITICKKALNIKEKTNLKNIDQQHLNQQLETCENNEIEFDDENDFPQVLVQNTFINAWHKTDRALKDPKIMIIIRFNHPKSM